jgi:uncharacterized protein (DUF58 family)
LERALRRIEGPSARALGLAGAGVAALVASQGFGTSALATLGAGLIALPALVTVVVWVAAAGLDVRRRVEPARLTAGEPLTVRLEVTGWPTLVGLDRLLELSLDPGLGSARGSAPPARRGARAWVVRSAPRGDHRLPPSRLRVADPFGLARRTREGRGDDAVVVVVPRAPAIDRLTLGARRDGRGPRRRLPLAGFGELERVRDYQPGDPLSRVHWAQTAKRGRLQTKELRAADGSGRSVVVLVDGAAPAGEALEIAVSAGAAVARHAAGRGEPFGLVHTGRRPARMPVGRATWAAAETALTRLEDGGERSLALALRAEATAPDPPDLVLVATSAGDAGLSAAVVQAVGLGVQVAVVLCGPAAAAAGDLSGAGADVAVVHDPDDLVAALSAADARARVS